MTIPDTILPAIPDEVRGQLNKAMRTTLTGDELIEAFIPIFATHFAKERDIAEDQANNLAGDLAVVEKERDDLQATLSAVRAAAEAIDTETTEALQDALAEQIWQFTGNVSGTADRLRAEGWERGSKRMEDYRDDLDVGLISAAYPTNPFLTPKGTDK